MSQEVTALTQRATELRQAFDRSFAEAPGGERAPTEAFLTINAGGDGYALRLTEISGLYVDKKVTPLPSASSDLIGLASFRGVLVPVYDLRVLLGYAAATVPRWLVLTDPKTPIGLVFDRFEAYLHLPHSAIAQEDGSEQRQQHVARVLRTADKVWPIVSVTSILESIKKRAQTSVPQRER